MATLLIVACSKDEVDTNTSPSANSDITFNVDEDNALGATRATTRANFDTKKQFRVYAWTNGSNIPVIYKLSDDINSNVVSYNTSTGVWNTQHTFYWPDDNTDIDFYAFHPVDVPFDADNRQIVYTMPIDGHTDPLYAKAVTNKRNSNYTGVSNTYSAQINFRHALCRVVFLANVNSASTDLSVIIRSLQICNVMSQGAFNYPTGSTTSTDANSYGSWASLSAPTIYSLDMTAPMALTTTAVSLTEDSSAPLLIPQALTAWDPTTNTIAQNDALATPGSYLKIGCSILVNGGEYADDGYIYCPFTSIIPGANPGDPDMTWTPANTYTYALTFANRQDGINGSGYDSNGKPIVQSLVITAAIKPWNTTTSSGTIY